MADKVNLAPPPGFHCPCGIVTLTGYNCKITEDSLEAVKCATIVTLKIPRDQFNSY